MEENQINQFNQNNIGKENKENPFSEQGLKKLSAIISKNKSKENENEKEEKKAEKIKTNLILYIGNLPGEIDNYELYEMIRSHGNFSVDSMNIKKTREENTAFAYVKFGSKKEVEEAKKKIHLSSYKNKIIKADLFRKEEKRKINDINSNIFFKGFPKTTDPKDILTLFSQFGEIHSIKPIFKNKTSFTGTGYLSFKDPESAADAIMKLNGTEYQGTKITVIKFNKLETRVINSSFPVIICRNLPSQVVSSNNLSELLKKMCDITLCGLFQEKTENYTSTSGIALLPSADEVEKILINSKDPEVNIFNIEIIQAEYNKVNCDRLIDLKKNSLKSKYQGSNLIVKNIPKEISEKDLYSLFTTFGPVKSVKISTEGIMKEIKDSNGIVMDKQYVYESKGFGYVLFTDHESASKCIEELNNVPYGFKNTSMLLKLEYFNYDRNTGNQSNHNNNATNNKPFKKGGKKNFQGNNNHQQSNYNNQNNQNNLSNNNNNFNTNLNNSNMFE